MSAEFVSRILGMIVFTVAGTRLGVDLASAASLSPPLAGFVFALVGVLVGLIVTPWLTVRPYFGLRRALTEMPVELLFMSFLGLLMGTGIALLATYPLSQLAPPLGSWMPTAAFIFFGYMGVTVFRMRAREVWTMFNDRLGIGTRTQLFNGGTGRELVLDTSVLIDGRIVEVAQSGFLGGSLVVPRFVLSELHQVADSSDLLRRNRGRRGLAKLNEMQRDAQLDVVIIDDDIDHLAQVDDKLVALAIQRDAGLVTNDYNLNQVAQAQGILVLNINELANAVRAVYIPGETFPIHVIQEGREDGQGVGYLEDGTMVVVENGLRYMDRTIKVTVTRLINIKTGRMLFATPSNER